MIYKVGLLGASGKVGGEVAALLASGFSLNGHLFELADAVTGTDRFRSIEGVETRTLDEPAREPVHVWIDFSTPQATCRLLETIDTPIVIGTTGFSPRQLQIIDVYATRAAVLLAPNTSIGVSTLIQALSAATLTPASFPDVTVEETHHKHKKDAPSGTAKWILETLSRRGFAPEVHVTRGGSIRGEHHIRFLGMGEELVLTHRVQDRSVFARGALVGADFLLQTKVPRIYEMTEVGRET